MLKSVLLFAALMLAPCAAAAADTPPPTAPLGPDQMEIGVGEAFGLFNALSDLLVRQEVTGKGENKSINNVRVYFPANTAWIIRDDIKILRDFITPAQDVMNDIRAKATKANGDKPPDAGTPEFKKLEDELQAFWKSKKPIKKLTHIKRADLGMVELSPAVLDALDSIIDP